MAEIHQVLPQHLVGRIFDAFDTRERAQLTLVCKTWKEIAESNCSRLKLSFSSLKQLYYQRRWIDRIATKSSTSVRECHLYWEGGKLLHPALSSLQLEQFINLEVLHLKPPGSAYWAMTPRVVANLAPMKNLRELVLAFYPANAVNNIVTLDDFAAFPKLQLLDLVITNKQAPITWTITLSPRLQGLRRLEDLSISGLFQLTADETARKLIGKLKHLAFAGRHGFKQAIEAPRLETLRFNCVAAQTLPFSSFHSLTELDVNIHTLDLAAIAGLSGLRKLTLGCVVAGVDGAAIARLANLQRLEELSVLAFEAAGEESLQDFCAFPRLRKLHIDLIPARRCTLKPELGALPHLQELHLNDSSSFYPATLCGGLEGCQALERLRLEVAHVAVPITSPSLRHLSLRAQRRRSHGQPLVTLTDLPLLHSLHLLQVPSLEECGPLMSQLAALPSLRELAIIKGYVHAAQLLEPDRVLSEAPGSFERLLHRLKALPKVRVLRIAAVNDDVSLSSTIMPSVEHLGLASRGVAVCQSALPWNCPSLHLAFRAVSPHSLELLEASCTVSDWQHSGGGRWLRARWPWSAPASPDFSEEVFDDAE